MQISFGVAVAYHFSGADVSDLLPKRFTTYDDADRYAEQFRRECNPTIYVILNDEYAFYCKRSAVKNEPYMIQHITTFPEGQVETRVWWKEFQKNPEMFLSLGQKI